MDLDKFIIGLLVFTAIIIGGSFIIGDLNNNYAFAGTNISTNQFGSVYDTTNQIYNLSMDMKQDVLGSTVSSGTTQDDMFNGVYKAMRLIPQAFSLVGDIINAIALNVGIPSFFIGLGLAALSISIIFAIIYIIFRVRLII